MPDEKQIIDMAAYALAHCIETININDDIKV